MSYRDIQKHIADMYALDISEGAITNITDKLIPELRAWQQRPLDAVYPFVWLDAIHYKIKDEGRYVNKAVYTVLGLNTEGHKELLGLYLSEMRSTASQELIIGSAYSQICRTVAYKTF